MWWCLLGSFFLLISQVVIPSASLDCKALFGNAEANEVKEWQVIEACLFEVSFDTVDNTYKENVLKSIKNVFGGVANIPPEHFVKINYILTALKKEDIQNITLDCVEVIEGFGLVKNTKEYSGFTDEQLKLLAEKVKDEWYGKNPDTYSEYDLMSLGDIVCHLDVEDIAHVHGDAFKEAAEQIGRIENCPSPQLQAFANLAKKSNAFGDPSRWTKLDVNILGNIVNGLDELDLLLVDRKALELNRYFREKNKAFLDKHRPANETSIF